MQAEAENTKFALEQKVLELQGRSSSSSSSSSAVSTPASGRIRQAAAQQQQQEAQRQHTLEHVAQQQQLEQQMAGLQKQNEDLLSSRCASSCESRASDTEAKAAFGQVGCCMTLQKVVPLWLSRLSVLTGSLSNLSGLSRDFQLNASLLLEAIVGLLLLKQLAICSLSISCGEVIMLKHRVEH